jgi:hypothetical protein
MAILRFTDYIKVKVGLKVIPNPAGTVKIPE